MLCARSLMVSKPGTACLLGHPCPQGPCSLGGETQRRQSHHSPRQGAGASARPKSPVAAVLRGAAGDCTGSRRVPVSKEKAGARAWLEQGQEAEAAGTRGRVVGKKPGAEVGPNCGGPWDQDGKLSFIWFLGEASEGL